MHGIAALAFVASIPFTKAVHMLTGPVNLAVRDQQAGKRLPRCPADARPSSRATASITDLSPEHLLSAGRLHEVRQVPRGLPGDRERATSLARAT